MDYTITKLCSPFFKLVYKKIEPNVQVKEILLTSAIVKIFRVNEYATKLFFY